MRTHIHGSWSAIEVLRIQWPARELRVVAGAIYWSVPLSETDTWPPLRVIAHVNDDSLIIPATDGRHRRLTNCWAQCIGKIWHIIWKRLVPRTTHAGYELWTAKKTIYVNPIKFIGVTQLNIRLTSHGRQGILFYGPPLECVKQVSAESQSMSKSAVK